MFTSAHTAHWK